MRITDVERSDEVLLNFPSFNAPTQLFTSSETTADFTLAFAFPFAFPWHFKAFAIPSNRTLVWVLKSQTNPGWSKVHVPKWQVFNIKKVLYNINGNKNNKWMTQIIECSFVFNMSRRTAASAFFFGGIGTAPSAVKDGRIDGDPAYDCCGPLGVPRFDSRTAQGVHGLVDHNWPNSLDAMSHNNI